MSQIAISYFFHGQRRQSNNRKSINKIFFAFEANIGHHWKQPSTTHLYGYVGQLVTLLHVLYMHKGIYIVQYATCVFRNDNIT